MQIFEKYHFDIFFQMFYCNMVRLCKWFLPISKIVSPIFQQYLNRVCADARAKMPHESSKKIVIVVSMSYKIFEENHFTLLCQMFGCKMVRLRYVIWFLPISQKILPNISTIFKQGMLVHVQTCEMIHLKATNIWTLYQVVHWRKCTRRKGGEIDFLLVAEHWQALKRQRCLALIKCVSI